MKKYLLFLIVILVFNRTHAQNETASLQKVDAFLQQEYLKKEPGAVVLIAKKGKVIFGIFFHISCPLYHSLYHSWVLLACPLQHQILLLGKTEVSIRSIIK